MSGALPRVLIVDDDAMFRKILLADLSERGFRVEELDGSGAVATEVVNRAPEVLLLDLNLPDTNGIEVLESLRAAAADCRTIMVTGTEDIAQAVRAIRAGAFDYVTKPVNLDALAVSIERAAEAGRVSRERDLYRQHYDRRFDYVESRNPEMKRIHELARRVAGSETTAVLIDGESGTGKELIANRIHQASARSEMPFLEVNCASLPEQLLESELFGHEKGSFTDASSRKRGLLELADGGTLFLDEVGEMAPPIQVKLLRVLERMTFRRVGGTRDIRVSVRVISATNRELDEEVKRGQFREDLYFRLKVVPVTLPPLRERPEDIPVLARHFLRRFAVSFSQEMSDIAPEAMRALLGYPWPGNIRELRNVMERAVLLHDGTILTAPMLMLTGTSSHSPGGVGEFLGALRGIAEGGLPVDGVDFEEVSGSVERFLLLAALETSGWNQTGAARKLRLNRDKLRTRMKNHGLTPPAA
ncbi:MAG: sigma-54 dependent transcriptional regulator [Gemmatimonadota bacterium]|nr:sigma-54 dependent transcriptional regulator [Gemmatimonadota bacterium]